MSDKEKFQKLIEDAGLYRNFPGSMARILVESGATFLETREMDYCNGKAAMREGIIAMLTEKQTKARGAARSLLEELIAQIENLEVA